MMKTWLRLLLVLTAVGGGCAGVLATSKFFFDGTLSQPPVVYVGLFLFGLYSFLTAAGLWFVFDENKSRLMLIAFASQIPWVDLPGLRYQVCSLLSASIAFGPPHGNSRIGSFVEWGASLGTEGELRIGGSPHGSSSAGVNLYALFLALFLLRYARITHARAISVLKNAVPES